MLEQIQILTPVCKELMDLDEDSERCAAVAFLYTRLESGYTALSNIEAFQKNKNGI